MKKIKLVIIAMVSVGTSFSQTIPNEGFESWTSMGSYSEPDAWGTLNSTTNSLSFYTSEKGTPGNPGNSYLKLTSKSSTGGVVNGIATSGVLDPVTMKPRSGFAYNMRSSNLTGKWQHMIFGSSQGFIEVQLTRWDAGLKARMPVASGKITLSGMAMSWTNFTVPLTYTDKINSPDSCMITLSASGNTPTDGDYLWIDNLAFSGTVASINHANLTKNTFNVMVYPNPSSSFWNIKTDNQFKNVGYKLYNYLGEEINIIEPYYGNTIMVIDNQNLAKGVYQLVIYDGKQSQIVKLIKE